MKLIIVESPAKARTIKRFLDADYELKATLGHIVDLPEKELGVDIRTFDMKFVPIRGKKKVIDELKKAVKKASKVYLSTDPDREGEAIAFHVVNLTKPKNYSRIELHAIIPSEIKRALSNPRDIDYNRVNSQFARRFIDRIVGYFLSPLASKSLGGRLSVGRVQSPALRLIVEREQEIRDFVPEPFWQIVSTYEKDGIQFAAKYPENLRDEAKAKELYERVKSAPQHHIRSVQVKESLEHPPEPYRTATLQQEASAHLGLSPEKTMQIAQWLYEHGYITYHRTDSPRISDEAIKQIRKYIKQFVGEEYLPPRAFKYRAKGLAQDAHEAIRPTIISPERSPENIDLQGEHLQLYTMIWYRAIASQMAKAKWEHTKAHIDAGGVELVATGKRLVFDGWRKFYPPKKEEILPALEKGESLEPVKVELLEKETQPPSRYTESTLVKTLEKLGIGRPSTYATIISTLKKRRYVNLRKRVFYPTEKGERLVAWLKENYPWVVDYGFTARMEEALDKVEEGSKSWQDVVLDIYKLLEGVQEKIKDTSPSDKQREFALQLSEQIGEEIPEEILSDRRKLSRWIDAHKPPTQKQIDFAKAVAKDLGLEIPEETLKNQKKLQKWLDDNLPPTPKQKQLLDKLKEQGHDIPDKAYRSKKHASKTISKILKNARKRR